VYRHKKPVRLSWVVACRISAANGLNMLGCYVKYMAWNQSSVVQNAERRNRRINLRRGAIGVLNAIMPTAVSTCGPILNRKSDSARISVGGSEARRAVSTGRNILLNTTRRIVSGLLPKPARGALRLMRSFAKFTARFALVVARRNPRFSQSIMSMETARKIARNMVAIGSFDSGFRSNRNCRAIGCSVGTVTAVGG
jgi:hypothetical protein